jgi:CRP-like cAMP-binding protein
MFDGRVSQLEAVASESCRVLHLPVLAIKERARKNPQLARTLERIAREDLARKLEHLVGLATDLPR